MAGRVFLRGSTYWIAFNYKGKEYRRSSKTDKKREADKLLAFYLAQCAREEFKGFLREDTYMLYEMLDDFVADYEQRGMRSIVPRRVHVRHLKRFNKDMPVDDITERHIDLYIKHRLKVVSRTTVNRETQTLGQAMRLAKRKKLINDIPHIERFSEKENARKGFFEREDFEKIVAFLPDYAKDIARFAYTVGWRKGEILTLQWEDVHEQAIHLKPEVDKSKDGRVIPLIGEIAAIIGRRRRSGKHPAPMCSIGRESRSKTFGIHGIMPACKRDCQRRCSITPAVRWLGTSTAQEYLAKWLNRSLATRRM